MSNFTRHQKDGKLIILITIFYMVIAEGTYKVGFFFLIIIAHISYKMMFHVLEFK